MRNRILTAALLAALSAPAFAQDAEEEPSGPFSYNIGVFSDYAFRGVSQTNEGPAVQGGIDFTHDSGFHAGVWASNVDYVDGDGANYEVDYYIGWAHNFSDTISFDATALYYSYIDQSAYEYLEFIFDLGVGDYLGFQLAYSSDVFNSGETGIYYEVNGSVPLPWWELTMNGAFGHYDLDDTLGDSYQNFNLGLSKPLGPMTVGLNYYYASDDIDWGDNGGARTVLSAVWAF
jgi:uncharacterized protein (TIGR02001 family)